ncbi:UNVERIFIED_CONTAM: hypothetical protein GTU68_052880 [Idotea baltica]|nr:hypothetical protein [Idotea baltica]
MHITLLAVGRIKSGPEREMLDKYLKRAGPIGRGFGVRSITEIEVASGGGIEVEGERLLAKIPTGAHVIRLDEGGKSQRSVQFSENLQRLADQGVPDLVFLIGGAEGYSTAVRAAAPKTQALGPQTWPHRLARVMLAEQVYRALSILSGSPYHKP